MIYKICEFDETTILRFRHFLEENNLQEKLFKRVNKIFENKGYIRKEGTIGGL